jgi:hypothetical protein
VLKAFNALGRRDQLRFIHGACLHVGLDPLKMAPRALFGLPDEEPESAVHLLAEVPPATHDAADLGAESPQDAGDGVSKLPTSSPAVRRSALTET